VEGSGNGGWETSVETGKIPQERKEGQE